MLLLIIDDDVFAYMYLLLLGDDTVAGDRGDTRLVRTKLRVEPVPHVVISRYL